MTATPPKGVNTRVITNYSLNFIADLPNPFLWLPSKTLCFYFFQGDKLLGSKIGFKHNSVLLDVGTKGENYNTCEQTLNGDNVMSIAYAPGQRLQSAVCSWLRFIYLYLGGGNEWSELFVFVFSLFVDKNEWEIANCKDMNYIGQRSLLHCLGNRIWHVVEVLRMSCVNLVLLPSASWLITPCSMLHLDPQRVPRICAWISFLGSIRHSYSTVVLIVNVGMVGMILEYTHLLYGTIDSREWSYNIIRYATRILSILLLNFKFQLLVHVWISRCSSELGESV